MIQPCYTPPQPEVTLVSEDDIIVTAPPTIPEGWRIDLIYWETPSGEETVVQENVSAGAEVSFSDNEIILSPEIEYGVKWKPIRL